MMIRFLLLAFSILFAAPAYWTQKSLGSIPVAPFTLARLDTTIDGQIHDTADTLRQRITDSTGAMRTLIDGKEPTITAGTSSQVYLGPKAWGQVADAQVASGAAIAWSKISKTGAVAADVGAASAADLAGYLPLAGGTMTGILTANAGINIGSGAALQINGTDAITSTRAGNLTALTVGSSFLIRNDPTWPTLVTNVYGAGVAAPGSTNYALSIDKAGDATYINGATGSSLAVGGVFKAEATSTGLAVTGSLSVSSLSAGGIVKAAPTTGLQSIASAGTDYVVPSGSITGSAATLTAPRTLTIGSTGKSFNGSADVGWSLAEIGAAPATGGSYLPLAGGTIAPGGMVLFNQSVGSYGAAGGIWGQVGGNDWWGIRGGSTGDSAGYLEIATGDDGTSAAEPIYVRQYSGAYNSTSWGTVARTLTLLDGAGNTGIPGTMGVYGLLTANAGLNVAGGIYSAATVIADGLITANAGISATHVGTTTLSVGSSTGFVRSSGGTYSASPLVAGDVPTLNQSTTGSAATLTAPRTLTIGSTGKSFNGSADVAWSLAEIGAAPATGGSYLPLTGGTMTGILTANAGINIGSGAALQINGTDAITSTRAGNLTALTLGGPLISNSYATFTGSVGAGSFATAGAISGATLATSSGISHDGLIRDEHEYAPSGNFTLSDATPHNVVSTSGTTITLPFAGQSPAVSPGIVFTVAAAGTLTLSFTVTTGGVYRNGATLTTGATLAGNTLYTFIRINGDRWFIL